MLLRRIIRVLTGITKNIFLKALYLKNFQSSLICTYSFTTSIIIEKSGFLKIGKHLSALNITTLYVGEKAELILGDRINLNNGVSIVSRKSVKIGSHVSFGPNCGVYDHDHDYKKTGRERQEQFTTGSIIIGNNVWFGANCTVLKNTVIGDNCVFGAGSVIKGNYPDNTIVYDSRNEIRKQIVLN